MPGPGGGGGGARRTKLIGRHFVPNHGQDTVTFDVMFSIIHTYSLDVEFCVNVHMY